MIWGSRKPLLSRQSTSLSEIDGKMGKGKKGKGKKGKGKGKKGKGKASSKEVIVLIVNMYWHRT